MDAEALSRIFEPYFSTKATGHRSRAHDRASQRRARGRLDRGAQRARRPARIRDALTTDVRRSTMRELIARIFTRFAIIRAMKYRQLADTGVFVSELCLGAMTFGGRGGMWEVIAGLDQTGVDAIVHRSIDAGINFIDTANVYALGESETLLGKSLEGRRHDVVLATKVRGRMGKGANDVGPLPPAHHAGGRREPETPGHRLHRPLSDPPLRHARRTSRTRCARSTISCAPARCATSAARTSPPGRS